MSLKDIKEKLFPVIKVISIVAIATAIGLEIWDIQALTTNNHLPIILNPVLIIARLALSAHFVEGIIAARYAPAKKIIIDLGKFYGYKVIVNRERTNQY